MKIKTHASHSSFLISKIYVDSTISHLDSSNFKFLLGYRQSLFSLLNPFLFQYSLKTSFLFLESFLLRKYKIIIISDIEDQVLFNKFYQICKNNKHILLKASETSSGFLTNKKLFNTIVITLFLDPRRTELIQQETSLQNVPLISFSNFKANRFSSSIYIGGNYDTFLAQNLVLTLLSICLEQKKEHE
jgi:hypothetical protein